MCVLSEEDYLSECKALSCCLHGSKAILTVKSGIKQRKNACSATQSIRLSFGGLQTDLKVQTCVVSEGRLYVSGCKALLCCYTFSRANLTIESGNRQRGECS